MAAAAAAAKLLQSCPTRCYPIDGSPLGSSVPGILQVRILEWVAISFSNARKWKVKVKSLSRVRLFATPWTAAYQAPPSMGFSRQEYWSGVPLPSPQKNGDPVKNLPGSISCVFPSFVFFSVCLKKISAVVLWPLNQGYLFYQILSYKGGWRLNRKGWFQSSQRMCFW